MLARFAIWVILTGAHVFGIAAAADQSYPYKSLRFVTCEVGGGSDLVTRMVAQGVTGGLGQTVIVENRPCGVIPGDIVSVASPDGYTVLVSGSPLWLSPLLKDGVRYDPVKDFSPITLVSTSPTVLVVHPSMPAKSVKELIALAKAKPGTLNYAAAATGSPNHLAGELLKFMAGVNIVAVPYKGTGPSMTALLSGECQLAFANVAAVLPHMKAGRLIGLGVSTVKPSALAPGLPTIASTVPGYEMGSIYGIWAPAKTPAAAINRLNREVVNFLKRPDVKEKFFNAGLEAVGSAPGELSATIKADMVTMGKVIKNAGIRAQ